MKQQLKLVYMLIKDFLYNSYRNTKQNPTKLLLMIKKVENYNNNIIKYDYLK
jgi:hypothetical protein